MPATRSQRAVSAVPKAPSLPLVPAITKKKPGRPQKNQPVEENIPMDVDSQPKAPNLPQQPLAKKPCTKANLPKRPASPSKLLLVVRRKRQPINALFKADDENLAVINAGQDVYAKELEARGLEHRPKGRQVDKNGSETGESFDLDVTESDSDLEIEGPRQTAKPSGSNPKEPVVRKIASKSRGRERGGKGKANTARQVSMITCIDRFSHHQQILMCLSPL
ncbi:hypothetical protein CPB83DRAFT_895790 [Crepidotus variabilis]|uniref:Uncharacterized protein n=1 Tax=Crepidotus variabilis TaxID=179855 RepID=A0A9P6JNL1_9AGAR|nr:hypothetical protein CPB83DRAFT_895790 [Crepidotus variabilis]